jgi:hypothetical protein
MVTSDGVLAIVQAWRARRRGAGIGVLPASVIACQLGGLGADPPPSVQPFVELLTAQVMDVLRELAMAGEVSVSLDGLAVIA